MPGDPPPCALGRRAAGSNWSNAGARGRLDACYWLAVRPATTPLAFEVTSLDPLEPFLLLRVPAWLDPPPDVVELAWSVLGLVPAFPGLVRGGKAPGYDALRS